MNNQRNKATRRSIRSPLGNRLPFVQPLSSYSLNLLPSTHQTRKEAQARTRAMMLSAPSPAPIRYKMPVSIRKNAQAKMRYKRSVSPLKYSQWRSSPSSGLISSLNSSSFSSGRLDNALLQLFALRVEDFEIAEKRGLRLDFAAVADDHNLHVCGIEIFLRGGLQIIRR